MTTSELQKLVDEINKSISDAVMLIDENIPEKVDVVPTGIMSIDKITGIGGIPRGKITEIFGNEATGKTTLCLQTIAQAHQMGLNAAFIDMEHSTTIKRMKELGVDTGKLIFSQPNSGEEALMVTEKLIASGKIGIVVVDSVAALVPMVEMQKDMGDSVMGVQARLMSQAMRKLNPLVAQTNTALIFINQTRTNIGMFSGGQTTTGGNALKFYASLRLKMTYKGKLKEGGKQIGRNIDIEVVKNKLAVPFQTTSVTVTQEGVGEGATFLKDLIDAGIVKKSAGWYRYGEQVLGQGIRAVYKTLQKKPELKNELLTKLK